MSRTNLETARTRYPIISYRGLNDGGLIQNSCLLIYEMNEYISSARIQDLELTRSCSMVVVL